MKKTRLKGLLVSGIIAVLLASVFLVWGFSKNVTPALAGNFLSGNFTNAQGSRPYKLYVPTGYTGSKPLPLLVALHGCTQDPDNFATGTRFNTLAESQNFLVLYPQQTSAFNASKCWNWFVPEDQARGSGEPAIIAGMVDFVRTNYKVDSKRIFVAGLSAGGAMASIMGSCYPDVFAATAVHSGLEYKAATDLAGALIAQETGGPNPDIQGKLAYDCAGAAARVMPVILFQGDNDFTVNKVNGDQVIAQFAKTDDYADDGINNNSITAQPSSTVQGQVPGGYSYTVSNYNAYGSLLLQKYIIISMGHAWSGGSTDSPATYTDPKGPDASTLIWNFFQNHPSKL